MYTCLLVALATSIMLTNNCNPFILADLALSMEHIEDTTFTSSVVTSSSCWFRFAFPSMV